MLKNIDWEKAMNIRRSTRSFEMRPVEEEKMSLLQSFIDNIQMPFEHNVNLRMFKANTNKKLYTIFPSPPDSKIISGEIKISKGHDGYERISMDDIGEVFNRNIFVERMKLWN